MGREEQIEERGVLDSIYPDEITDISETSYRVSIALDVPGRDEEVEPPSLILTVAYPPSYPDTAPHLDITFPPSAPRMPHLSLPEDKPHLLSSLDDIITECIGQVMIFTLISALKDSAEQIIGERLDQVQAVMDEEKQLLEEEENKKFHGEAVTRESFLRWRKGFRNEVEREEEERRRVEEEGKSKKVRAEEGKLSGRVLWERGLVGKVEEEGEEEGEVDALRGVEGLRVGE